MNVDFNTPALARGVPGLIKGWDTVQQVITVQTDCDGIRRPYPIGVVKVVRKVDPSNRLSPVMTEQAVL